jgi:hypothetical protein
MHAYSFIDVDSKSVELIKKAFANEKSNPQRIRIELTEEKGRQSAPKRKRKPDYSVADEPGPDFKKQNRREFFESLKEEKWSKKERKPKGKRK